MSTNPLLSVRNLKTHFHTDEGVLKAVDGISFDVNRGETVCLVGESGSGKSVTAESITRLVETPPGEISGEIRFDDRDITTLTEAEMRCLRGGRICHVFQNSQGALNPVYTVGYQIREAITAHHDVPKSEARKRAISLLDSVGIPEAATRIDDYPHEFSGGMGQRVTIAIALAGEPDLLIADEPTTALDVTIEAQILDLFTDLQSATDMGILVVTHDLGVVAEIADTVVVLYAGAIMEAGPVEAVFKTPAHPYTKALLECLPGQSSLEPIPGSLPSPTALPPGCRFADRCTYATEECHEGGQPPLYDLGGGHRVSCVHWREGADGLPEQEVANSSADESRDESRGESADKTGGKER